MQLKDLLKNYGRGVLLVSHDRNEVYRMCSRIAMIDEGKLLTLKDTKEFFANPESIQAAILSGCKNIAKACKIGEYEVFVPEWNLTLTTKNKVQDNLTAIGIRAHYFNTRSPNNRHEVIFIREMEEPFEWVLEFRFKNQNSNSEPLWWRLPKDKKPAEFPKELGVAGNNILLLY